MRNKFLNFLTVSTLTVTSFFIYSKITTASNEHIIISVENIDDKTEEIYSMINHLKDVPLNISTDLEIQIDNFSNTEFSKTKKTILINTNTPKEIIGTIPFEQPLLVNKHHSLSSDYIPQDLVIPDVSFVTKGDIEKNYMSSIAAAPLEEMFNSAKEEGIFLYAVSGYRSYERQHTIYTKNVQQRGVEETDKFSARPGHSEHQTGLAMDISSSSNNFNLNENFGNTQEGKWLEDNAHKFGFILRYPKNKEHLTEYHYEPWHYRYVGLDIAEFIHTNNLTLEEFTEMQKKDVAN